MEKCYNLNTVHACLAKPNPLSITFKLAAFKCDCEMDTSLTILTETSEFWKSWLKGWRIWTLVCLLWTIPKRFWAHWESVWSKGSSVKVHSSDASASENVSARPQDCSAVSIIFLGEETLALLFIFHWHRFSWIKLALYELMSATLQKAKQTWWSKSD